MDLKRELVDDIVSFRLMARALFGTAVGMISSTANGPMARALGIVMRYGPVPVEAPDGFADSACKRFWSMRLMSMKKNGP